MLNQEQHVKMFGCTKEALDEMMASQSFGLPEMLAMSILSDAQEMVARVQNDGHCAYNAEVARQFINQAKYVLQQMLVKRESRKG